MNRGLASSNIRNKDQLNKHIITNIRFSFDLKNKLQKSSVSTFFYQIVVKMSTLCHFLAYLSKLWPARFSGNFKVRGINMFETPKSLNSVINVPFIFIQVV